MTRTGALAAAVAGSVVIHLVLVVVVPGLRVKLPVHRERLVEVELSRTPLETEPEPLPRPVAAQPIASEALESLGGALAEQVLAEPAASPAMEPIRLPARSVSIPEPDRIAWTRSLEVEPSPLPAAPVVKRGAAPGPDAGEARRVADRLLQEISATPVVPEADRETMRRLEIEGPVGVDRKVLSEPRPPRIPIRNPATVSIKFYVSPRGEVVRAFPVQRGDPELDQAALAYIKAFRFNPLPTGEEVEQWGTIRVRFRLE